MERMVKTYWMSSVDPANMTPIHNTVQELLDHGWVVEYAFAIPSKNGVALQYFLKMEMPQG